MARRLPSLPAVEEFLQALSLAAELALPLAELPGVLGVFFGHRQQGGHWLEEGLGLAVHLRWKRPLRWIPSHELLPSILGPFAVDVLEVGLPQAHVLDHIDEVWDGGRRRVSSITAVSIEGEEVVALMSGHGTLPFVADRIVRRYRSGGSLAAPVVALDNGQVAQEGLVLEGSLAEGQALDYALAVFPGLTEGLQAGRYVADHWHLAAGQDPPLPVRLEPLVPGEFLWHYSRLPGRFRRIRGKLRQISLTPLSLELPDRSLARYPSSWVVESGPGEPVFSLPGDSGSLVVDAAGRAVGTVLGGAPARGLSYVLPLAPLLSALGPSAEDFFSSEAPARAVETP